MLDDAFGEGYDLVAFSTEELEELKLEIAATVTRGRLTAWQTKFLVDINSRIDKYGRNVRLSDKQLAKLEEIMSSPGPRQNYQPRSNVAAYARLKRRSGFRPYRPGRFGRKMTYRLATLAIVLVAIAIASMFDKGSPSFSGSGIMSTSSSEPKAAPRFTKSNITRNDFSITDGDTIRVNGERKGTRLVGFNTPETIQPGCQAERALGLKAKARLRQLVSQGRLNLERVRCSCKPGTEGTNACNYGRSCGTLSVDGRDVGDTLVSEGLAVPFVCGSTRCPPTPKPWCG